METPESAAAAVQAVVDDGYDSVKVYNNLTAPASEAVYREASRHGLPIDGDSP